MEYLKNSFYNALATLVYVVLVVSVISNAERIFKNESEFFIPIAMLMLFVTSATIVGTLVLGRPLALYLDNKKTEAVKFLFETVGYLIMFTVIAFVVLIYK